VGNLGTFLLIPVGLLAAGPARVEKTVGTTANPQVSISNYAGKVVVKGWDKPQVHVVYDIDSAQIAVDVMLLPSQGPAEKVHFLSYRTNRSENPQDSTVNYVVQVPTGASLEIHNPLGSVRVESIQGDTSVESLGGSISVADVGGHLSVRSVGGNIDVTRPSGRVEAFSINGNLHFIDPTSSMLRASTNSGDIVYEGGFAPGGEYILSDYSGNVNIFCPPTASFEVNAKTVRGKVDNSFPLVSRRSASSAFSSANSLFGTHSTGEATLELTSFSGTIRIRPQ
jgi:phage baseplate assembly protein gpV